MLKSVDKFLAYTDYPLDGVHQTRQVELLAYDRNKYVTILHKGECHEIKAGYIFNDEQLSVRLTARQLFALPKEPDASKPSKIKIEVELKASKRKKTTQYALEIEGERRNDFNELSKALAAFSSRVHKTERMYLTQFKGTGRAWSHTCLMESNKGSITLIVAGKNKSKIKSKTLKRFKLIN